MIHQIGETFANDQELKEALANLDADAREQAQAALLALTNITSIYVAGINRAGEAYAQALKQVKREEDAENKRYEDELANLKKPC